jgi:hypothetical protein
VKAPAIPAARSPIKIVFGLSKAAKQGLDVVKLNAIARTGAIALIGALSACAHRSGAAQRNVGESKAIDSDIVFESIHGSDVMATHFAAIAIGCCVRVCTSALRSRRVDQLESGLDSSRLLE